ncbi:uncharacterized protein [Aquarana catesbeiana]|uniref:uncharacterized protein n=1 Tax=Aquarana catesbeiana TaxID=8400 RepID=UPI003CC9F8E9
MVPELIEGEPATLKCRIYNYECLHRMEGYQMLEKKPTKTYNNLPVEKDKTSDDPKTYIATLELEAVQMTDDGSEYEFRVQFSGARDTIKKSTGPIQVKENQSADKARENDREHSERPPPPKKENQSADTARGNDCEHSERPPPPSPPPKKAKLPDPKIGEIMVPELIEGEPATLKCRIYNYEESLHRMEGYQMLEKKPTKIYNNLPVEKDKTSDDPKTYIATLELGAVQMTDDGSEYEFRLQFPGARNPIKKSTGPMQVKGKNQASLQKGKNCTKFHTAENNKPQSSDQQQTCKPEN